MKCYYEYIPEDDKEPRIVVIEGERQGEFEYVGLFPSYTEAYKWGRTHLSTASWHIDSVRPIVEIDH